MQTEWSEVKKRHEEAVEEERKRQKEADERQAELRALENQK
jgi:hypothetical protein